MLKLIILYPRVRNGKSDTTTLQETSTTPTVSRSFTKARELTYGYGVVLPKGDSIRLLPSILICCLLNLNRRCNASSDFVVNSDINALGYFQRHG